MIRDYACFYFIKYIPLALIRLMVPLYLKMASQLMSKQPPLLGLNAVYLDVYQYSRPLVKRNLGGHPTDSSHRFWSY